VNPTSHPAYTREGEPTTRVNLVVLAALMALLAVTIGLAFVDLDRLLPGHGWGVIVALFIAALKAALVVAYFMHVRYGNRLTLVFALAGFVWLAILFVLVFLEVLTRGSLPHGPR
jgi:cytochrome c oxidase subunit IV